MLATAGTPVDDLYAACRDHFTHFIDLGKHAEGPRARTTADMPPALAYLSDDDIQTDVVLFNSAS
jgi:hypothetical protein